MPCCRGIVLEIGSWIHGQRDIDRRHAGSSAGVVDRERHVDPPSVEQTGPADVLDAVDREARGVREGRRVGTGYDVIFGGEYTPHDGSSATVNLVRVVIVQLGPELGWTSCTPIASLVTLK